MSLADEYGLVEDPTNPPRFDPVSLQLETRGVTPQKQQLSFWASGTIHKNTAAAKLRSIGRVEEATKLEKCHSVYTFAICRGCHKTQKFPNRCDLFYCAECQPRLSTERRKAVEWWTKEIKQPKHVVLTAKNIPNLTKEHVQEFRGWFTRLRRSKFCRNWLGGFYSLELTNEGRGDHLHLHALVDARWIDEIELSIQWQRITNGMGRIVDVKDARRTDYLKEVTKYAVKGVQLAAWSPEQIAKFIDAFDGVRTFGVFGSLYGARTKFREWFEFLRNSKPKCPCGCSDIGYYSESEFLEADLQPTPEARPIPPPTSPGQSHFKFVSYPQFESNFNLGS